MPHTLAFNLSFQILPEGWSSSLWGAVYLLAGASTKTCAVCCADSVESMFSDLFLHKLFFFLLLKDGPSCAVLFLAVVTVVQKPNAWPELVLTHWIHPLHCVKPWAQLKLKAYKKFLSLSLSLLSSHFLPDSTNLHEIKQCLALRYSIPTGKLEEKQHNEYCAWALLPCREKKPSQNNYTVCGSFMSCSVLGFYLSQISCFLCEDFSKATLTLKKKLDIFSFDLDSGLKFDFTR